MSTISGHLCPGCSPAVAASSPSIHDDYVMPSLRGPLASLSADAAKPSIGRSLVEAKAAMTALPGFTPERKRAKRKPFVAKCYAILSSERPRPSLSGPLEQQISVPLRYENFSFLTSGVGTVTVGVPFTLSIFNSYTSYTGLFDEYKIEYIECWIECENPTPSSYQGDMASAVDVDDASNPTSYDAVADRPGAISCSWATGRYHKWKPNVAVALYSGAFSSFGNEPASWIDCGSPSVQHYGLKVALAPFSGGATKFKLFTRALLSFRGATNT